jgi:hypothetical protein
MDKSSAPTLNQAELFYNTVCLKLGSAVKGEGELTASSFFFVYIFDISVLGSNFR